MIKNIIFDYDGVIVDSEILAGKAFTRYLKKYKNVDLSEDEFINYYSGNKTIDVIKILSKKYDLGDENDFFSNFLNFANPIITDELEPVEGIRDFLQQISQKRFIGSNNLKTRIMTGLKKVVLQDYFNEENIYTFDMVANPKPEPDVFLKVIEENKIKKDETIIIEDSVIGTIAGVKAGIKVIGLTAGKHWKNRPKKSLLDAGAYKVFTKYLDILEFIKN
ncbi:MAG: 6-phosphogluconate phosphatase [Alphaproteobacteria bacterium MarineAlpha5_Bin9]|nr:MAG: 6-phosphogluconate phosphatase [Alphaproteobacteria bacterium MarineAlpha5_Bin9]|tara:strand:+ start:19010 stop:19669 length:660 start_codon:yes stop_codon:yes gene_type:complete